MGEKKEKGGRSILTPPGGREPEKEYGKRIVRKKEDSAKKERGKEDKRGRDEKEEGEYRGPIRAFPIYPHPFPCFEERFQNWLGKTANGLHLQHKSTTNSGILYVRIMKVASGTSLGVVLRIAHRQAAALKKRKSQQVVLSANGNATQAKVFQGDHCRIRGTDHVRH